MKRRLEQTFSAKDATLKRQPKSEPSSPRADIKSPQNNESKPQEPKEDFVEGI
jgi:hypothetical protein